jgi:hypothetical protein
MTLLRPGQATEQSLAAAGAIDDGRPVEEQRDVIDRALHAAGDALRATL